MTGLVQRIVWTCLLLAGSAAQADADIEVTISAAPVPVAAGAHITYDIVIRNRGPDVAQYVSVGYGEVTGTTVSSQGPTGWQGGGVCITGFCMFEVRATQMPVGASANWRIVQFARASTVDPTAVTFGVWLQSAPSDPTPTPEVSIRTPIAGDGGSADLRLEVLSATNPAVPGGVATYRLRLTNSGPDIAQGVSVSAGVASPNFPTPPPAFVRQMQGPADWQCIFLPLPPGSVHCNRVAFPPGSAEFTVTVDVGNFGAGFDFVASASGTTPDPAPANNNVIVGTTIARPIPAISQPAAAMLVLLLLAVGCLLEFRVRR